MYLDFDALYNECQGNVFTSGKKKSPYTLITNADAVSALLQASSLTEKMRKSE